MLFRSDLSYANPHISPFDEFQRFKHHPLFAEVLEGGTRVSYGARAIVKGGLAALPEGITVGEAESREDLLAWASRVDRQLLAAGAAEFFDALLEARGLSWRPAIPAAPPGPSERRLLVSGTTSEHSRRALGKARERGVPVLPMPDALFRNRGDAAELVCRWAETASEG